MDKAPAHLLQAAAPDPAPAAADAVLRCQAAVLARRPLAEAATALAAELGDLLRCRRVSVGLLEGEDLRIAGSSQQVELDPRHDAAAAVLAAMHEALDQRLSIAWPPATADAPISLAQRQLAGTGQACSVPLVAGQRIVGALTLERDAGMAFTPAQLAVCEDVAAFAGPVLELKAAAEAPWRRRAAGWIRAHLGSPTRRQVLAGSAVLLVVGALALPWPWRVSAPARLEGSVQRAVVAATDGFLQQANVRPGDRVTAGQPLAQLSSQDLELERKRRESELRQHENAYRAAQARNDRTQMVISQSRAAEAQALLELAETQLERSQLVAPFDGVVIKGDLRQNLGAPVQKGETLLVLSPSDSFRLIVEVDEGDIGAVAPGQRGQLALAARPERPLAFTTRRIVPVATAADGRNYFEVEAVLAEREAGLRPGLSGVAKIEVGRRSLGWLLFHRAAAWMRLALWSVAL
ncbi:HlyD family efflux transporter periplasmic adaptor subunit [Ramlibacter sp. USB13]|uniref:HlyD family efflux transporter periplasmic adaptor subunit n=1 Tax=Ramlibacter cellulosilyticus TaxID=2764187 RepID=A0A923MS22_9BURK|nr:HlyD family efflux transporter periplasmic adaptor subunit [Ramlibacter cellulosilyticus]MBC5783738.1 HlyD family efflux transporter periplasmic adaptor subunit [Ramlibacter cellulosilyticus]